MTTRIRAFFQHMPPYSGAAALRGQSIIDGLSALLAGSGSDIGVFTTTPNPTPLKGGARVVSLPVAEVENSQGLVSRMVGEVRMGMVAARAMFGAGDKCSLAIVSTPGYLAALVVSAWARWRKVPYVIDLRDVYPQVYAEAKLLRRGSLPYRFFAARSRKMYEGARLVIAATQGLAREVATESPRAEVACVYNGFPASLRERQPVKHDRFTVCFHGTMGFFQDVETLIRVAERLQPEGIDMVVIGYGRKEGLLRETLLPNLRFLGRMPFDATIAEIERCHMGLCTRLDDDVSKDAFPVKVWEYLGLGMPCIVTPSCEAGEFLAANRCGYQLATGDVDGIVRQVLALRSDPAAWSSVSAQCRAVGAQYTRERTGRAAAELVQAKVPSTYVA